MVWQAWFDDSGSSPNEHVMVLAGYISGEESWADFSGAWQSVLAQSPKLDYFKMSEAMGLRDQFSLALGWTAELRNERLIQLAQVIRDHASYQVCASLLHQDFQETIRELPAFGYRTLGNDRPYNVLWFKLVSEVLLVGPQLGLRNPINFFFDEQQGYEEETRRTWSMIRSQLGGAKPWSELIGSEPQFRDEEQFLPLQAADFLAWLNRRSLDDSTQVDPALIDVLELLEPIPPLHIRVTREWMSHWFKIESERTRNHAMQNPAVPLVYHNPTATKRDRRRQRPKKPRGA